MNKYLIGLVIVVFLAVGIGFGFYNNKGVGIIKPEMSLENKKVISTPEPTVAPPNAPKVFQYDSATDLDAELEEINPQINDSDFE